MIKFSIIVILILIIISVTSCLNITTSNFRYIVSNKEEQLKVKLPKEVTLEQGNNCLGIVYYQGRLYLGWRTAPFHFASKKARLYIISSENNGTTSWDYEHSIILNSDVREPYLIIHNNMLYFTFFQAGTNPIAFEPQKLFKIQRIGYQQWTEPEQWGQPGEIAWQFQTINNEIYVSSYIGEHYQKDSKLALFLNKTKDFINFQSILNNESYVYLGGISELGFTFNDNLDILAVGRNEDGDQSGFGSRYFFVSKAMNYQNWQEIFPSVIESNPDIYESPRMFTWKNKTFLVGRRDLNPPYGRAYKFLPFDIQKYWNLATYSLRAHTTSIWLLNQDTMKLEFITDLPGDGDTAFPSIIQIDENKFTIANYASPLGHPNWSWIWGQLHPTQIYFIDIEIFE